MNRYILLTILGLVLCLNIYICWRLWRITPGIWAVKAAVVFIYIMWMTLMFVSFIHIEKMPLRMARIAYSVGNTWLIVFLYLLLAFITTRIVVLFRLLPASFLKDSPLGFFIITGGVALLMVAGHINYHRTDRKELTIITDKPLERELKIVLISDLHLGYHSRTAELKRWIETINAENPDLVLTAGDFVDRSMRPLIEGGYAEYFHRLKAPIWTVFGNHEYYSNAHQAKQFFEKAGIRLLRDEKAEFAGITVVGRDDRTNPARKPLSAIADNIKGFSILLDHQPYHLEEAQNAGIDFQFSGHTHRGQVWPVSWITDVMYEKSWGHHRRGNTEYYITSGLGIWGARIRIGTRSEYLVLNIKNP